MRKTENSVEIFKDSTAKWEMGRDHLRKRGVRGK
jgi:hypothetical protein